MTSPRLYAFIDGKLAGRFDQTSDTTAHLTYTQDHGNTPLSLSLPFDGTASGQAAYNYLDNLLPDNPNTRLRWATSRNTTPDTFNLLTHFGEDIAGAVTLTPDPELPHRPAIPLVEATLDDIAHRVVVLSREPSTPPPANQARWSLGGQQAKFSLAHIDNTWYWSTWEHPSTHIFKPAAIHHTTADLAEHVCLDVATRIGISASTSILLEPKGQRVFVVERWDRTRDGLRLHAEDLNQALGRPTHDKYRATAPDLVHLLSQYGQEWAFIRQLAFNIAAGNSDAHAKNYSILIAGDTVRLAPLYDALPIFLWPRYNQQFAMPIGKVNRIGLLTQHQWVRFAQEANLDSEQLLSVVEPILRDTADILPDALRDAGLDQNSVVLAAKHSRLVLRSLSQP